MDAIFVGGPLNGQIMNVHAVEMFLSNGQYSEDMSEVRKQGGTCHRKELDHQPLVDGYLSPMWDNGRLRYETQEAYDLLSR